MTEQTEPTQQSQPGYPPNPGYHQPGPGNQGYPPPPYKRLTRPSDDSPISGVCAGLARYAGIDPTLVRVLAVVLGVVTFPVGLIVYAVLWAVIPRS